MADQSDTLTAGPGRARGRAPLLVRWPSDAVGRAEARRAGTPCLLVVPRGHLPPVVEPGEDWIWSDADERDVSRRLADLARCASAPGPVGPPGAGPVTIPAGLRDADARIAAVLLRRRDRLVPTADLEDACVDHDAPASAGATDADVARRDLALAIRRLRRPLADAGWAVRSIGGAGFLVEEAVAS